MEPAYTESYKGLKIELHVDDMAESPREWDCLGKIVTTDNRYWNGDETSSNPYDHMLAECVDSDVIEHIENRVDMADDAACDRYDYEDPKRDAAIQRHMEWRPRRRAAALEASGCAYLPVFMMAHSGVSISTGSGMFRACDPQGWDWGQVGWIYATKDKVDSECNGDIEKAKACLESEIEIMNQFISGDVYWYKISVDEDDAERDCDLTAYTAFVDGLCLSCGGLYGHKYALAYAKEEADHALEEIEKERNRRFVEKLDENDNRHPNLFDMTSN